MSRANIGQTGCSFKTGFTEHITQFKLRQPPQSYTNVETNLKMYSHSGKVNFMSTLQHFGRNPTNTW